MRGLILFLLSAGIAMAQLAVTVRSAKDTYLLYEGIPITITIRNYSGRTIQLENSGTTSWLKFLVTDERSQLVPATDQIVGGDAVLVPAGESVTRTIDLLPFYELRSRGSYRVQALVNSGAITATSAGVNLSIIHGRELWSQTVGLPMPEGMPDEYRVYSLVSRRDKDKDLLFIGVRAEPSQAVYSLVPLGHCLSTAEPQARVDKEAHLHVLFQNGPRSYGYVHVDPMAKVIFRGAYSDYMSLPELKVRDGQMVVVGGEQTYPKQERILTDEELNPPPPPPPPPPKKKWWWPFEKKHEPGTDQ